MSGRDEILARVRGGLGRNPGNRSSAETAVREALAKPRIGPRPRIPDGKQALIERFCAKSTASSSTVERIADRDFAPAAAARYLTANQLSTDVVVQPALSSLAWSESGICPAFRGAQDRDLVGITGCFCAIAETGTLMLVSNPDSPATVSLLPETHIAIVNADAIVPTMEDAWALLRNHPDGMPRAVNFVSGPSRTGDIELTIVLGAHGPYRVHLIVVCPDS